MQIEIDGKYGLAKLPKYLSSFTDGDLTVDETVDQVLSAGFNVEYSKYFENGFTLKPFSGISTNKTLSGKTNILADGERKDAVNFMDDKLAKKIGLNISKNSKNFNFGFDYEFFSFFV